MFYMAQARQMDMWNHTSGLLCMMHNLMAEKKDRKQPSSFHPMMASPTSRADRNPFTEAKEKFAQWRGSK
jgi:hypothetical protein